MEEDRATMKIAKPVVIIFLVYFPLALLARATYVDSTPSGRVVVQLLRPYLSLAGYGWRASLSDVESLHLASGAVIFEDRVPLADPRASYDDVRALGHGR